MRVIPWGSSNRDSSALGCRYLRKLPLGGSEEAHKNGNELENAIWRIRGLRKYVRQMDTTGVFICLMGSIVYLLGFPKPQVGLRGQEFTAWALGFGCGFYSSGLQP